VEETAAELLTAQLAPPRILVENLLHEGAVMLAGGKGDGKSFLALDTARCLATGADVLGCKVLAAGDVLYLDLENGRALVQERLRLMLGGEACDLRRLHLRYRWGKLDK
jgi:RecA-family ATPase